MDGRVKIMNGYYDVVEGRVVWRFHKDAQPDIVPPEVKTDQGTFQVVLADRPLHNEGVRLPDLGRSATATRLTG
jgi:hypothetical protein